MNYRDYIKNGKLVLPEGFNSPLNCSNNKLSELILPEGFNSWLNCKNNNLTELILPEGFNRYLNCYNNQLNKLILPEGFNRNYLYCDETVKVYYQNEWLDLERERKLNEILEDGL